MSQPFTDFDHEVRQHVYEITLARGHPPTLGEAADALSVPVEPVRLAYQRLADAHVLVIQPDNGEILMASPFSAVPTPFLVRLDAYSCFGNCIWDALGIPAMLKQDAHIQTACPDCGAALELSIVNRALQPVTGIVHFALPARRWWDDIVFN